MDNGQRLGRVECRPMTRSELIARITARSAALTVRDVETAVKAIFEGMTETLANGEQSFVFIDPEDPEYDKVCEAYEKLMDSEPYEA